MGFLSAVSLTLSNCTLTQEVDRKNLKIGLLREPNYICLRISSQKSFNSVFTFIHFLIVWIRSLYLISKIYGEMLSGGFRVAEIEKGISRFPSWAAAFLLHTSYKLPGDIHQHYNYE